MAYIEHSINISYYSPSDQQVAGSVTQNFLCMYFCRRNKYIARVVPMSSSVLTRPALSLDVNYLLATQLL